MANYIKIYVDKTKEGIKSTLSQPLPNPFSTPQPQTPQPKPQPQPQPPVQKPTPPPQPEVVKETAEPEKVEKPKEEVRETPKKQKGPSIWKKTVLKIKKPWVVAAVVIFLVTALNGFFLLGLYQKGNFLTNLAKSGTEKVLGTVTGKTEKSNNLQANDSLVAEVGSFFILPNEEAEIATITDVDTLRKTEDFFDVAENGDKLLVYKKAKKVILYRPGEKKIVAVAPLLEDNSPTPSQTR